MPPAVRVLPGCSYKRVVQSDEIELYVTDQLRHPDVNSVGTILGALQQNDDITKYLIGPELVPVIGNAANHIFQSKMHLKACVHEVMVSFTFKRMPALMDAAVDAIMTLNMEWFCSNKSFLVLGVHARPHIFVIECDSFFGLF